MRVSGCSFVAVLAFSLQASAYASGSMTCEGQSLRAQGVVPKIITPGNKFVIPFLSSSGRKEAELEVSASNVNGVVTIRGKITSLGECIVNTFQPLKLYPVRNGLPLGWHSLPDGLNANPTLPAGQWVEFYRHYSADYRAGFNLALGTWRLDSGGKRPEEPTAANESAPASLAEELFSAALEGNGSGLAESEQRLQEAFARAQEADRSRQAIMDTLQQTAQTLNTLQTMEAVHQESAGGLLNANPGYGYDYGSNQVKPIEGLKPIDQVAREIKPVESESGISRPGVR